MVNSVTKLKTKTLLKPTIIDIYILYIYICIV